MTKKGGAKKPMPNVPHSSMPLGLEATRQQLASGARNPKSMLKIEQLENLARWASSEASIPSLAAFFGHQFATAAEASATPIDPSLVSCQRCETILEPGFNCTVRIQKMQRKSRRRNKKQKIPLSKNIVVYKCHFCSHWNPKRGTPKGHVKEICPPKVKPSTRLQPSKSILKKSGGLEKKGTNSKDDAAITNCPETPATPSSGLTLLDSMKRKRNKSRNKPGSNKPEDSECKSADAATTASASRKKRRKQWTSLKEIAESSEREKSQSFINLTTPLFL